MQHDMRFELCADSRQHDVSAVRAGCVSCPGCAHTSLAVLAALYTLAARSPFAAYLVLAGPPALTVRVPGCCILNVPNTVHDFRVRCPADTWLTC